VAHYKFAVVDTKQAVRLSTHDDLDVATAKVAKLVTKYGPHSYYVKPMYIRKGKASPQTGPQYPYVVVCLDDDERTTWISSHDYHCIAVKRYEALEAKYPNGSFDVWSYDEAKHLPLTSFIF